MDVMHTKRKNQGLLDFIYTSRVHAPGSVGGAGFPEMMVLGFRNVGPAH